MPTRDERQIKKNHHMSDPATSGDSAATAGAAIPAASSGNPAPVGTFGAKGSGLARGKRPTPASAPATSAAPTGYQPSALEVIRPQSEYKNPFTGETSVPTPVVNEPAPQAAPAPVAAPVFAEAAASAPAPVATAAPAAPAAAPAQAGDLFPFTPAAPSAAAAKDTTPAAKAELNILPPQEVKRPAVSWGEHSAHPHGGDNRGRREDRGTFRPERRDQRPFEPREPREPRRDFAPESRDATESTPSPAKKSGGFFAWLKGLFGGSKAPEAKPGERDFQGRDGQQRYEGGGRRRHRGGRGRGGYQGGGENRGPRDGQPRDFSAEGGGQPGGEQSGEQRYEGGGRRRRRGGRNRHRDDRGPRPEGQQGGGAI